MVNINKLKGKIVECGLSVSELASIISIDRATLYRKIADLGETFTIKEVDAIVKALELTPKEANAIFFSQFVA